MAAKGPIIGTYEYVKPAEKHTQTLVIKEDGTCTYDEVGETRMEKWSSKGQGTWHIESSPNGDVVRVVIEELTKDMFFKIKTNVRGIEDGTSVQNNVSIPIFYKELAEAKNFGSHKWRRKQ
uniref:Uncharacterized protein n=1 Tax=Paramoeba aestuarina TaxID=180227 RepID=A0A7S4K691_9EUKA